MASPILGYASTINDGLWWSLVLFKWCLGKVFYCWVESRDLFRFISMFFSRIFKSSSFFGRKFGFPKSRDELKSSYSVTNILSDVPTEWNMPCDLSPATPGTLVIMLIENYSSAFIDRYARFLTRISMILYSYIYQAPIIHIIWYGSSVNRISVFKAFHFQPYCRRKPNLWTISIRICYWLPKRSFY